MKAYFVRHPRQIEDLMKPHRIEQEQPYEIVKEIILLRIDYENFTTDMRADRQFIEDHASLCADGAVKKCLFIRMRNHHEGILIIPEKGCYVKCAAYHCGQSLDQ